MVDLWTPMTDHDLIHDDPAPLYLGSDPGDYLYDNIREFGLIVNLMDRLQTETAPHAIVMHYSMIDIEDTPELIPDRDRVEAFLWAVHVFAATEKTLWHCAAGLNRSGFMLAAYLHLYRQIPIRDAIALLREKREPTVLNNKTFERTLLEWYG